MEELFEFIKGLGSDLTATEIVFLWLAFKAYKHVLVPLGKLMSALRNEVEKGTFGHEGPTQELVRLNQTIEKLCQDKIDSLIST
jgi:hypothetical protein